MENKPHAAIYIRVSTDFQAEQGYSIEAQKEQLAAYCVAKGIKNYEYYIDGGWSGSNIDRPEIQRLISDVKDGKISHCIVYKLDRLSRSQKDTLYLIEDVFNPHNVSFVSLNENMDTSTPMGRLMLGILSAFAQLERENIRMRTRMGMRERVKSGLWMGGGRTPFGYDYDPKRGILIKNADSEKVEQIYDLYIKGYSAQNIANMLGLKYDRLATQILKRKSNYGIIEYNGEEYQGQHEAIISKETYDLAMAEMAKRSISNVTTSKYLLTGLLFCGKCGAKLRYQKWGKTDVKLVCYSKDKSKPYLVKDENCDLPNFFASDIEKEVLKKIFLLKEKDFIPTEEKQYPSVINLLNTKKNRLVDKIKRLYNIYANDGNELLLETIDENNRELTSINQKIEKEKQHLDAAVNKIVASNSLHGLEDRWEHMTLEEQQHIIRILVNKVILTGSSIEVRLNI